MRRIDYFFSAVSTWAYVGHALFVDIARRHGCDIRYRPVSLSKLFPESGGLPLKQRHPLRQRYRWLELQRWREKRGIPLNLTPKAFPFDATLPDRAVIAAVQAGKDPEAFVRGILRSVWAEERDPSDPVVLAALAEAAGLDSTSVIEAAGGEAAGAEYARNLEDALAIGVFGSPTYIVDGELFWGQDRLELLDEMLASGRAPYRPL